MIEGEKMADFYDWEKENNTKKPDTDAGDKPFNYFKVEPNYDDYDIPGYNNYSEHEKDEEEEEEQEVFSSSIKTEKKTDSKKKTKITALCCLAAIIATILFSIIYLGSIPKVAEGSTDITLVVVYPNGETDTLPINTSSKFLGDALTDAGYAESDDHSSDLYKTINGVMVEEGAKWVFTREGKELSLSVNKTPIEDGEIYTATYTK